MKKCWAVNNKKYLTRLTCHYFKVSVTLWKTMFIDVVTYSTGVKWFNVTCHTMEFIIRVTKPELHFLTKSYSFSYSLECWVLRFSSVSSSLLFFAAQSHNEQLDACYVTPLFENWTFLFCAETKVLPVMKQLIAGFFTL